MSNQSVSEERFNRYTHLAGLFLSLSGLYWVGGHPAGIVYGLALVLLFGVSTAYHSCRDLAWKRRWRLWDHCAIYLLIAGSYTPFMAVAVGGWRGWSILVLVWLMAAAGIRYKLTHPRPFGVWSVLGYLMMGWMAMLVLPALRGCLAPGGFTWLVGGGATYTLGVTFYAWEKLPYSHGIWHLFVLGGAMCHYLAVVLYVL